MTGLNSIVVSCCVHIRYILAYISEETLHRVHRKLWRSTRSGDWMLPRWWLPVDRRSWPRMKLTTETEFCVSEKFCMRRFLNVRRKMKQFAIVLAALTTLYAWKIESPGMENSVRLTSPNNWGRSQLSSMSSSNRYSIPFPRVRFPSFTDTFVGVKLVGAFVKTSSRVTNTLILKEQLAWRCYR